ncbi:D-glycero-beta-D-manno-heptose 1-phosphate adenylyltransferase [Curtobacterium ammoniigenes]|uniref:D-glycero-beta-D-manno-heptose 1-phosphate adenylyltransferase n=1 Tax=Curtobacterium ammoniigenes TaxID=395387 RepID=UPI00082CC684|nr:D-glycero-beta-D-manno-heptose 1-phosphate adenylyltransferase [Curtobacterium ammoniigenes]
MTVADPRLIERVLVRAAAERPVVTVVGDMILDRWSVGLAERVSREAPAPVVRLTESIDVAGGAANTAANLAALGADVRMVAFVGDDDAGRVLRRLLDQAGVDTSGLVAVANRRTATKTRIVGGDRVVVRVDDLPDAPSDADLSRLGGALARALVETAAVVVCDYELGIHPDALIPAIQTTRPATVVVDAHEVVRWTALAPDVVTPNSAETERLLGRSLGHGADRVAIVSDLAEPLRAASGARNVIVTLDRDGTVVFPEPTPQGAGTKGAGPADAGSSTRGPIRTRATPASEQQASGAGDTFCATLTLALAVGEDIVDAARIAQTAADVVVREAGTSVCQPAQLREAATGPVSRVVDHDDLVDVVAAARHDGRRIVFTNGCFDVVHRGHTTYLRQARQLGDLLVVAVNDDDSVRRLKGPERPINSAEDRAGVLAALACVDLVTVFATDTPIPLLERVRPDVYVKGGDYSPDMLAETDVVRSYGGEVVMVDYVPEHSTSEVVRRIREAAR